MSVRSTPCNLSRGLVGIALGVAAPTSAMAAVCEFRMTPPIASAIAYDPFGATTGEGSIRVTVDLISGEDCEATLALVDDAGAPLRQLRFGNAVQPLTYRIEVQSGDGVLQGPSADLSTIKLTSDRRRAIIVWRLLVDEAEVLATGEYNAFLQVELRGSNAPVLLTGRANLSLRSVARAQANFAGTHSGFANGTSAQTIDFGPLTTGEQRSAFLQIRANTAAHLTFRSANRGYLVNRVSDRSRIAYSLEIDGTPSDMSVPISRSVTPPLTINGTSLELKVTIGDIGGKPAGRYSDTVDIEISP